MAAQKYCLALDLKEEAQLMAEYKSYHQNADSHGNYSLEADVTIKNITKTISMDLFYHGKAENPMSQKTTAGFSLSGSVNRKDFSIGPEIPNLLLSEMVAIQFNGEFIV